MGVNLWGNWGRTTNYPGECRGWGVFDITKIRKTRCCGCEGDLVKNRHALRVHMPYTPCAYKRGDTPRRRCAKSPRYTGQQSRCEKGMRASGSGVWGGVSPDPPRAANRPGDGLRGERAEPRARLLHGFTLKLSAEGIARTEGWARSARPVGAVRALPGGAAGRVVWIGPASTLGARAARLAEPAVSAHRP